MFVFFFFVVSFEWSFGFAVYFLFYLTMFKVEFLWPQLLSKTKNQYWTNNIFILGNGKFQLQICLNKLENNTTRSVTESEFHV